jgi:hypothetical protein
VPFKGKHVLYGSSILGKLLRMRNFASHNKAFLALAGRARGTQT